MCLHHKQAAELIMCSNAHVLTCAVQNQNSSLAAMFDAPLSPKGPLDARTAALMEGPFSSGTSNSSGDEHTFSSQHMTAHLPALAEGMRNF